MKDRGYFHQDGGSLLLAERSPRSCWVCEVILQMKLCQIEPRQRPGAQGFRVLLQKRPGSARVVSSWNDPSGKRVRA